MKCLGASVWCVPWRFKDNSTNFMYVLVLFNLEFQVSAECILVLGVYHMVSVRLHYMHFKSNYHENYLFERALCMSGGDSCQCNQNLNP